ncbi:hypothetical protein KOW79_000446 [Hemibagrus wyckioides]|uniref:Uncharacterized protein n=1 Tax=Hemibagrus wyckioides TaxID=337641 RepID=A0A9D3P6T9_9TELE|nr:hypothetical protein KOW79_000446 [Hemibagrus wyckioides]
MTGRNLHIVFSLTFDSGEQQISWSFLKEALKNLKQTSSTPPPDFSILDCILPKVQSSGKFRRLQPGCPLTNTILNLALKHLGDRVFDFRYKCEEHRSDEKHKRKDKEIMSMCDLSSCLSGLLEVQLEIMSQRKTTESTSWSYREPVLINWC